MVLLTTLLALTLGSVLGWLSGKRFDLVVAGTWVLMIGGHLHTSGHTSGHASETFVPGVLLGTLIGTLTRNVLLPKWEKHLRKELRTWGQSHDVSVPYAQNLRELRHLKATLRSLDEATEEVLVTLWKDAGRVPLAEALMLVETSRRLTA